MHFTYIFFLTLLAVASSTSVSPDKRQAAAVTCRGRNVKIVEKDCNRALLALGGGIAGKIQFLKVKESSSTATVRTCTMTIKRDDGKANLSISKGRLEGNGDKIGYVDVFPKCKGSAATVKIDGGFTLDVEKTK